MLPTDPNSTYCEPFFGMGGVWRQRPPVRLEILNDRNHRIINWWRVVRDHGPDLGRWLEWSPALPARPEWEWAQTNLDHDDPVTAAYAMTVYLCGSYTPTTGRQWYSHQVSSHTRLPTPQHIGALTQRLKGVLLEDLDATDLIRRYITGPETVIYADPPYQAPKPSQAAKTGGADRTKFNDHTGQYSSAAYATTFDPDAFSEVICDHPGRVVISGYGSEWDHLGWERHELEVRTPLVARYKDASPTRIEVAWANYPINNQQRSMF